MLYLYIWICEITDYVSTVWSNVDYVIIVLCDNVYLVLSSRHKEQQWNICKQ